MTISNEAFRRGVHAAVQAIIDDFADLVARRTEQGSPQQLTQAIVAMSQRIAGAAYPTLDPGPSSDATPDVPATPRPTPEMQIVAASLRAEESGLNIRVQVSSDGVTVIGRAPGQIRDSVRGVSWSQIAMSETPALSEAVETVIGELSR